MREPATTVVDVEPIRLSALRPHDRAELGPNLNAVVLAEARGDFEVIVRSAHDLIEAALLRWENVHGVFRLVVGDVKIEISVPIHVGERRRRAPTARGESRHVGGLDEFSVTVVQEQPIGAAERGEEQIEIAITVDVNERSAERLSAL